MNERRVPHGIEMIIRLPSKLFGTEGDSDMPRCFGCLILAFREVYSVVLTHLREIIYLFIFYYLKSAIRVQSILLANWLAMSQSCGRTIVMRSPPARRSRSPYYRSAGHRCFSFRTTLSRGMGWSSGFKCGSSFIRCLVLLAWMMSCTVGIARFSWIIALVTYSGATTIGDILRGDNW